MSTNLLFFEKGSPTQEIWYYEHRLPEGQKSYSKTKSIQFEEFQPLIEWWSNRIENEVAWKVKVEDLKDWDLDIKNPVKVESEEIKSSKELLKLLTNSLKNSSSLISEITKDLHG